MKKLLIVILVLALLCAVPIFMKNSSAEPAAPAEPVEEQLPPESSGFSFSTTDLEGNACDESMFSGYELIMINFWEPWCGPCVAEMPDLQRISQDYADKGLLLVGVFSTADGAAQIVESNGITYPVLNFCDAFMPFQTGYVPTTVFMDAEGNLLSEPYIGAASYEQWAQRIDSLL